MDDNRTNDNFYYYNDTVTTKNSRLRRHPPVLTWERPEQLTMSWGESTGCMVLFVRSRTRASIMPTEEKA